MDTLAAKTIRARVIFEKRSIGRYAGQWTTVGRGGRPQPVIDQNRQASNTPAWAVTSEQREVVKDAEDEIPVYTVTTKTVWVSVPWRTSGRPLTAEEIEQINRLATAEVGGEVVVKS